MARTSILEPLRFHSMAVGKGGLPHDSTAWLTEGGDSPHVSSIPRFYTNGVDAPNCEIGVLFLGSENEANWRFLSNDFVAQGHHYRRRMQLTKKNAQEFKRVFCSGSPHG